MKILVTGASGFIGCRLFQRLSNDHEVFGVDMVEPSFKHDPGVFSQLNLVNGKTLTRLLGEIKPEAVIHLAARTDLNETRDLSGYAANIDGVRNLTEAVRCSGT